MAIVHTPQNVGLSSLPVYTTAGMEYPEKSKNCYKILSSNHISAQIPQYQIIVKQASPSFSSDLLSFLAAKVNINYKKY